MSEPTDAERKEVWDTYAESNRTHFVIQVDGFAFANMEIDYDKPNDQAEDELTERAVLMANARSFVIALSDILKEIDPAKHQDEQTRRIYGMAKSAIDKYDRMLTDWGYDSTRPE